MSIEETSILKSRQSGLDVEQLFPAMLTGFQPAFRHRKSGESHLAQIEPGIPSNTYCFAGLPEDWIVERDLDGNALALHPDIIPGYWRDARFISLDQLSSLPLDA